MIKISHTTRRLIIIMGLLSVVATIIFQVYYKRQNASVDPRIQPARELYEQYNDLAVTNDFDAIFKLLDSIESIYQSVDHYKNSFETGVLYNNRAAVWITKGLHDNGGVSPVSDSLFSNAESAIRQGIYRYKTWQDKYSGLEGDELTKKIRDDFSKGLEKYPKEEKARFTETRKKEIEEAKLEIDRRLSVSYTNLGIIHRYRENYDSAAFYYTKALKLWNNNLTAENNMNILLGKPQKKRNLIQRMFPRERIE